jgi:hypothetical protein
MGIRSPAGLISISWLEYECHGAGEDLTTNLAKNNSHLVARNARISICLKRLPVTVGLCEQRFKIARGYNPRGFVTNERKQSALVTCHKIVSLACFGQGQEEIIRRIG